MGCSPSKVSKVRDPAPAIKSKSRTSTNTLSVIDEESENEELEQELSALIETSSASSISDSHVLTDDDDDISFSEFVDDDTTSTKEDTGTGINGENEQRKESPKHVKYTEGKKKSKADEKISKTATKQVRFTLPNEGLSSSDGDWKIKSGTVLQPKRQTYITLDDPSEFIANYPEVLHERQINWYNNGCYFDLDRDIQGYNLNKVLYMFRDENTESPCSIM
ncbi:uncharacterized protein LOC113308383 isoform X2 [Papaver somniferum]|uniref:uncharacterized protein LOC113308383 isoform X2 n=1 Tax=Papaver somniferum TaxID=3469 RepID=UPI000E6F7ED5|nr:uncharacterized protein LOC113308383 isoform X2 [Papaver somniferum]